MDVYHVWCNLKDSRKDLEFCRNVEAWLGHLRERKLIEGFRITRRKLGLAPDGMGEFHIWIETRGMAQLDLAFQQAATREGETERLHAAVYSMASDLRFALYRDFPDSERKE